MRLGVTIWHRKLNLKKQKPLSEIAPQTLDDLHRQLRLLRWLAWSGQICAVCLAAFVFDFTLPLLPISILLGAYAIAALALQRIDVSTPEPLALAAELVLDMSALAALLFFSGGVSNPFASLLLLPLALAASSLAPAVLFGLALFAVALFGALLEFNVPLVRPGASPDALFALHRFGMWLSFVIAALLLLFFLSSAAARLRLAAADNARLRHRLLRDETIHAVALHAAHTAHALNSPLMTLSTGLGEITASAQAGMLDAAETIKDVQLLQSQLGRCIEHVRALAGAAAAAGNAPQAVDLQELLATLRSDAALLAPLQQLEILPNASIGTRNLRILDDGTLRWVLWGLVQNGWQASALQPVSIHTECLTGMVQIDVRDLGSSLGTEDTSSKSSGLGIGLTLSHASLERLGGSLTLIRHAHGTTARVQLPLQL